MSAVSAAPETRLRGGGRALAAVTALAVHTGDAQSAHELLGRKGLLSKEPATRLALCAVHRALGLPPGRPQPADPPDPRTAVVASSNLGNVETVARIVATLRDGARKDVSPLDAPNASSNVIASTVAIWFGLGGPNLTLCSGSPSGLDAVAAATLLLRSDRADRVVVVGAEPDDEVATLLHARRAGRPHGSSLRAGSAALVLEAPATGRGRAAHLGPVHTARDLAEIRAAIAAPVVVGPAEAAPHGSTAIDVVRSTGDFYGALGVLQVALAAELIAGGDDEDPPDTVAVVCGDPVDGWRAVTLTRREAP